MLGAKFYVLIKWTIDNVESECIWLLMCCKTYWMVCRLFRTLYWSNAITAPLGFYCESAVLYPSMSTNQDRPHLKGHRKILHSMRSNVLWLEIWTTLHLWFSTDLWPLKNTSGRQGCVSVGQRNGETGWRSNIWFRSMTWHVHGVCTFVHLSSRAKALFPLMKVRASELLQLSLSSVSSPCIAHSFLVSWCDGNGSSFMNH